MTAQQILQDDDRLRLALRLAAREDIAALDTRALNAIWLEIGQFLGHEAPAEGLGIRIMGDAMAVVAAQEHQDDYRRRVAIGCRDRARDLLAQHFKGGEISAAVEGRIILSGHTGRSAFSFQMPDRPVGYQLTLTWLLLSKAGSLVRKCPECEQPFVRVRRQIYCSDKCTDRATWRNYPTAKKRRARKKQYSKNGWIVGARSKGSKGRKR